MRSTSPPGAPLTAAIPGFYSVFTPINTLIFARTRNIAIYRFIQLLLVFILPWLVMMSLGEFRQSSAVIVWAALSPLGLLDVLCVVLYFGSPASSRS